MTEQNKKGAQVVKRNTEEEQCLVYLEASLGISVTRFSLLDTIVGKGNKIGEGLKNRVFITSSGQQQYRFYLGNFSIDKILPNKSTLDNNPINQSLSPPSEMKINKVSRVVNNSYKFLFGQANLGKSYDLTDIKGEITSSTPEINPIKNRDTAFKYLITGSNTSSSNNKLSVLKNVTFEITYPIKCCDCGNEESPSNPMVYCWTDKKFFCINCDKNWHEQKEKRALGSHYRTTKYKYTLTYFGNCQIPGHLNKPFQYFDEKNKTCLCVKCVESLNSNERVNQDISYIEDYLKIKKSKESLLNSKINSVCEDIKQRLVYAEGIWEQIDQYEKQYCVTLEEKRQESTKMMKDEGYSRSTFLSCIFMEIQRIIKEIDSKFIFNKNQRNNVDVSTFLYMNDIYLQYMQKELTANLDFLSSKNLETFVKLIVTLNDSNSIQYPTIEFDEYNRDETPLA